MFPDGVDRCDECNRPLKNGRCPRCDRKAARASSQVDPFSRVKTCRACRGLGWISRSSIVGGRLTSRAARCRCLHDSILAYGGSTGNVACAQDAWGPDVTKDKCDDERDRLMRDYELPRVENLRRVEKTIGRRLHPGIATDADRDEARRDPEAFLARWRERRAVAAQAVAP
jgi:hypothetical protein